VNRCLNVLSLVLKAAVKRRLLIANPVALVHRPKEEQARWRIFTPSEVGAVERAFNDLITEAETERDRDDLIVSRRLFLVHMGLGIRRGEAAGLRWRYVLLADPDGPVVRIEEAWVRHRVGTPKSRAGKRTISLGARLSDELWKHRQWSPFSGDDEYVFPNPRTGKPLHENRYSELVKLARHRAGITEYVRPSHDLRHSSITNAAAAGVAPEPLMSRSGHSSYATTRRYIDLAGVRFREEADRIEDRLWGDSGTKNRYQESEGASLDESQDALNRPN
jgi:integrase